MKDVGLVFVLIAIFVLVLSVIAFGDGSGYKTSLPSASEVADICEADQYGCVEYGIGDSIQIGGLLWVGDPEETIGTDSQRGVELAVDYLDGQFDGVPGEVLGHPVEIVIADDGCDAATGRRGANNLADSSGLLAVVGTTCSSSSLGAADRVLSSKGILMVSPSNTAPELTEPFVGQRFYARTAANDLIQGSVVADFAKVKSGASSAVVIHDETPYSKSLAEVFAGRFEYLGGRADLRQINGPDQKKVENAVKSARRLNPDIIYFPVVTPVCNWFVEALAKNPSSKTKALTSDGCLSSDVLDLARDAGLELYASGPDLDRIQAGDFYANQFLPAYRKTYGISPEGPYHPQAFDAANLILDAMRRVAIRGAGGTLTVPRTALRDALREVNGYDGLSGVMECLPTGDCAQSSLIAVFRTPAWPVDGGAVDSKPIYSQSKTLVEIQASS